MVWENEHVSLPKKAILGILTDNLALRGSVLPLSGKVSTEWAKGLDIPRGGETVLYTGHMYQIMPYLAGMASTMRSMEDSWLTKFMPLGRLANKVVNISGVFAHAGKQARQPYNDSLRSIALVLKECGVQFGYLYEEELYTGALVYDLGVDAVFERHARRVGDLLSRKGVKRVITVDPHTTNVLRHVYPEVLDGFSIEVQSYLEVLANRGVEVKRPLEGTVVIHDSCVYARYEEVIEEPRRLLRESGLRVTSPDLSGTLTHCCGGPIESLFPGKARVIAETRMKQLAAAGERVVTMCPICLVNLQHAGGGNNRQINDISEYLARSLLGAPQVRERVPT